MRYSSEDLQVIIDKVVNSRMIERYIYRLNAEGSLDRFLKEIGYVDPASGSILPAKKDGKILVIGGSVINKNDLEMAATKAGFDKTRFEWKLGFKDAKRYQFNKLQYNSNYSAILVGPMPHKCSYETERASAIMAMANEPGFPPLFRMGKGNELCISKQSFTNALKEMKEKGVE